MTSCLTKLGHAWQANPEMFQKAELAREKALRNAYLNGQQ